MVGILVNPCARTVYGLQNGIFWKWAAGRWHIYKNTSCGLDVSLVEIAPLSSTLLVPAIYSSDPESISIVLK